MDEHLERLKAYVDNAKNHGQTSDQIRATLQRIGWQDDYIDQVLPPVTPKPSATKPVKTGGKGKAVIFFVALALIVGAITFWYFFTGSSNQPTNNQTITTIEYKDEGISFRYPATWKKTNYSELLAGTSFSSNGDNSILYFSAANYTDTKNYISGLSSTTDSVQLIEVLFKVAANSSLQLNSFKVSEQCSQATTNQEANLRNSCTIKNSADYAKALAGEETKTVFVADGSSSFNSTNPVLTEKIGTTVIDETTCYWVANGTALQPYVVLTVPGTTVVTQLLLKEVNTPQAVTGEIKDILNSIQVL
ncbi:hypothetical protein HY844_03075 [Candidatus Berkelbacteria bacterium]|nr:hypothetical protein [Candidatus Berkelbacteria bacterium]